MNRIYIKNLLLIMIFTWQVTKAATKRNRYKIAYTTVNCSHNSKYFLKSNCFKKEILGAAEPELNFDIILARELTNYRLNGLFKVPRPFSSEPETILQVDIDICKLLKDLKHQINLVQLLFEAMKQKTNVTKGCPLQKNMLYYLHNLTFLDYLPAFIPESDFLFELKFYVPPSTNTYNVTVAGRLNEIRRRWMMPKI